MKRLTIAIAALAVLTLARAAGPHPKIKLDWDRAGEVLTYQSCGCADACWTAELKSAGKPKAMLRCDCEKLYFSRGKEAEHLIADSCREFDAPGKMSLIPQRMKGLTASAGKRVPGQ